MHSTICCFLNVIAPGNYLFRLLDNALSVENEKVCSDHKRSVRLEHVEVK